MLLNQTKLAYINPACHKLYSSKLILQDCPCSQGCGCCCRSFPAKPNVPHVLSIATCPDTQSKDDGKGDPEGLVLAGIEVGSA